VTDDEVRGSPPPAGQLDEAAALEEVEFRGGKWWLIAPNQGYPVFPGSFRTDPKKVTEAGSHLHLGSGLVPPHYPRRRRET
jgi:hypothetical protein